MRAPQLRGAGSTSSAGARRPESRASRGSAPAPGSRASSARYRPRCPICPSSGSGGRRTWSAATRAPRASTPCRTGGRARRAVCRSACATPRRRGGWFGRDRRLCDDGAADRSPILHAHSPDMTDSLELLRNGIVAYGDRFGDTHVLPLVLALALHGASLLVRSGVWCGILRAAFPGRRVRYRDATGAYLAGAGANAIAPLRGGDLVRVYAIRRALPGASTTIVISTLIAETAFGAVVI